MDSLNNLKYYWKLKNILNLIIIKI